MSKTVEAAPSSTNVVLAKGTLTVAEALKFESKTNSPALTIGVKADSQGDAKTHIKTLKVEI